MLAVTRAGYNDDDSLCLIPHGIEIILVKKFLDREKGIFVSRKWIDDTICCINTQIRYYNVDERYYLIQYALTLFSLDGGSIDEISPKHVICVARVREGLKQKLPIPGLGSGPIDLVGAI